MIVRIKTAKEIEKELGPSWGKLDVSAYSFEFPMRPLHGKIVEVIQIDGNFAIRLDGTLWGLDARWCDSTSYIDFFEAL